MVDANIGFSVFKVDDVTDLANKMTQHPLAKPTAGRTGLLLAIAKESSPARFWLSVTLRNLRPRLSLGSMVVVLI